MKRNNKIEIPIETNMIDKIYFKFIKRYSLYLKYMDPWIQNEEKHISKKPIRINEKEQFKNDIPNKHSFSRKIHNKKRSVLEQRNF